MRSPRYRKVRLIHARIPGDFEVCYGCNHLYHDHARPLIPLGEMPCTAQGCDCPDLSSPLLEAIK